MLELKEITKSYEGKPLLNGISFQVDSNETRLPAGSFRKRKIHPAAHHCRVGNTRIRFSPVGRKKP